MKLELHLNDLVDLVVCILAEGSTVAKHVFISYLIWCVLVALTYQIRLLRSQ